MQNPAPSVDSNSEWQLAQRLVGEKKRLVGRGRGDRFEPPELTGELGGGGFRWTSFFSLFPDPHEVLAGEKTLPPPFLLPFLWCWATSGLAEWTPAAIALPCYRIQSKPQYGPDGFPPFFLRKFNEVGPLMADELSLHYLFNIQNQTLILWILCIDK